MAKARELLDATPRSLLKKLDASQQLYQVVHEHKHGASTFLVLCAHNPSEEEIVKYCDIDYEPELLETLEWFPVDVIRIPG